MIRKIHLTLFFAGMLASANAFAGPEADALQRFVTTVDTLSASFTQVQKDENGAVLSSSTGRMWLARPGKFRWSYEKPYAQLMVCDGKELWQYDPDLAQAMVRPAGATLQGTPAQLLSDRASLDAHFRIEPAGSENGAQRVRLLPFSANSDFKSVELLLKDGVPVQMRFHDPLGGVNEVAFSEVRTNKPVDAKLFRFDPPKGTEIIRTEAPAGK